MWLAYSNIRYVVNVGIFDESLIKPFNVLHYLGLVWCIFKNNYICIEGGRLKTPITNYNDESRTTD